MSSKIVEFSLSSAFLYLLMTVCSIGIAGYSYNIFSSSYSGIATSCLNSVSSVLSYISNGGYAYVNLDDLPPGASLSLRSGILQLNIPGTSVYLHIQGLQGNFNITGRGLYNFSVEGGMVEVSPVG
ncbi:MAG: hypothetical protein QXV32_07345 [Conexivisphaerales archaeon]